MCRWDTWDALRGAEIQLCGGFGSSYSLSLPGPPSWDMGFPGDPKGSASPPHKWEWGAIALAAAAVRDLPCSYSTQHWSLIPRGDVLAQAVPTPCRAGSG